MAWRKISLEKALVMSIGQKLWSKKCKSGGVDGGVPMVPKKTASRRKEVLHAKAKFLKEIEKIGVVEGSDRGVLATGSKVLADKNWGLK